MNTIDRELPKELNRVRQVLRDYQAIGHPGQFAAMMIQRELRLAEGAYVREDPVEMLRAYESLKDIE
jgi:hypothetical protein